MRAASSASVCLGGLIIAVSACDSGQANAPRQGLAPDQVDLSPSMGADPSADTSMQPADTNAQPAGAADPGADSGGAGVSGMQDAQPASPRGVTYHADIRPVIEARCLGCHVEGGSGPFPLDTYEAVDAFGGLVVDAVMTRRMPPWLADSSNCRKLKHDQRLTDDQLALFEQWMAEGFEEGDPATYSPIVEAQAPDIGEPTIVATAARPYQLRANYEEYVCLELDVSFPEDTYVTAMDLVPEHEEFVHHAIVSSGSGRCSALGTVAENIYSHRPGARTLVFEEGDALLIPAGSQLAVEFHYNTLFTERGADVPTDQSALRLWTLPAGQTPQRVITRYPFHDLTISIPVGATDATAGGSVGMGTASSPPGGGWATGEIIGVTPHMHALGKSFNELVRKADGTEVCLIDVPNWDWEWQLDYFFTEDDVVQTERSDTLIQRCVYSNTAADQPVVDGVQQSPSFTRFGQDSADEMCLGYVWFRYNWSDL